MNADQRRLIRGSRFALWLSICVVAAVGAPAAESQPLTLVPDVPQNRVWSDTDRSAVEFDQRKGEPALVLNKAAFRTDDVYLDIETDSKSMDFSSGSSLMQLQVVPKQKYRLLLNGEPGKETLRLNNKELVLQKPLWAQIMSEEGGKTFAIFFADATEVKVTFKPRDRAVKVR